jgi:DNA-binding transcriptional regulator LsrR (DeoR family)
LVVVDTEPHIDGQDRGPAELDVATPTPRFSAHLLHAAATLYYLQDATQAEVGKRLGTSRATVSRLLSEARRQGIVRIEVRDPLDPAHEEDLGSRTAEALGLAVVHIAPLAHQALLGPSLAPQLSRALRDVGLVSGDVLLVSSGRTIWETAREALPALPGIMVTPTVGGQDEPEAWYQTNEITRKVAETVGGRPAFLYAPAQPGPELYDRLVDDPSTQRVLRLWAEAKCAVIGVGAPPTTRESMPGWMAELKPWFGEAAGDICSRIFDHSGQPLPFPGSERLIATSYELLRRIPVTIAVAVGQEKIPSLLAGARAGWFNTLVTDAPTASALLARAEDYRPEPIETR